MKTLSLIVPCYNEEASLPLFYKEAMRVLANMPYEYELLFINDGSTDQTLEILRHFSNADSHVSYLSFSRNFGKEAAMYAGFCNVHGDYVAVIDADLQDPPSLLPSMIEILENEPYDSVATRRVDRAGEPPIRSMCARMFYKIINRISDADVVDGARDFRLMRKEMVDAIVAMSEVNRFSKGIFGWIGFRTYWLSYENVERAAGSSKWSFWKLLAYAINGVIDFSQAPLSIASLLGVFATALSLVAIMVIVVRYLLFGDPVSGWASTICIVIFIGGIIMLLLGIIGQYIAKMYLETKQRPHFIVSEASSESFIRLK